MPQFKRKPPTKLVGRKVVVACEGETEQRYFKMIRGALPRSSNLIFVIKPGETNPSSIVEAAHAEREKQKNGKGWGRGDTVWAVYDGEEHYESDQKDWQNAIEFAKRQRVELVISNPSFELWLLLHFQEQNAHIHRKNAIAKLQSYVHSYAKGVCPLLSKEQEEAAVTRANSLAERVMREGLEEFTNPSTGVARLVRHLRTL